jgi:hypothetical protein
MAAFYYNRHSGESYKSQWLSYLQNQSFANDITNSVDSQTKDFSTIIASQTMGMQETMKSASKEQLSAIKESACAVCGTIESGFELVNNTLNGISFDIQNVSNEISEMSSMLDWNFSILIEQQNITNFLLGNIAKLLRIPDSQKERQYLIEQGLKFFKNASIDADMYDDALTNLNKAEVLEPTDYFTLHRIGMIYMYSLKHLDIVKAEDYFKKAAKYAFVETHDNASISQNILNEDRNSNTEYTTIDDVKIQAAESFLFAARCCYIQGKFDDAAHHANKSFQLLPQLLEAGFMHAKALAAADKSTQAAFVLKSVINSDRYYSVKTLSDIDLATKPEIIILLKEIRDSVVAHLSNEIKEFKNTIHCKSEYYSMIDWLQSLCDKNNFLDALQGLDSINTEYEWEISNYLYDNFSCPSYDIIEIGYVNAKSDPPKIGYNGKGEIFIQNKYNVNTINITTKKIITRFECEEYREIFDCNYANNGELICVVKKQFNNFDRYCIYNITKKTYMQLKGDYSRYSQDEVFFSFDMNYLIVNCHWRPSEDDLYHTLIWSVNHESLVNNYSKQKDKEPLVKFFNNKYGYEELDLNTNFKKGKFQHASFLYNNDIYLVNYVEYSNSISIKKKAVLAKKIIIGSFKTFIDIENENLKNIEMNEISKKQGKLANIEGAELYRQAHAEDQRQKSKWFGKNYEETVKLYKLAIAKGDENAKLGLGNLTK